MQQEQLGWQVQVQVNEHPLQQHWQLQGRARQGGGVEEVGVEGGVEGVAVLAFGGSLALGDALGDALGSLEGVWLEEKLLNMLICLSKAITGG